MTPPGRAVTSLDSLAPDQRAAVELVLRQGRSYAELAGLLGIPEPAVRARARAALEALAPDLAPPPESGRVADWLLGQAPAEEAASVRALLLRDTPTRRWAELVATPLRELAAEKVPSVPAADAAAVPAPRGSEPARPRPLRESGAGPAAVPQPGGSPAAAVPAPPAGAAPRGRSSRLGGAILIGVVVLVIGGVLAFVLTRGGGNDDRAAAPAPTPTPTATAAVRQTGNDIVLRGSAGSKAAGIMRLFKTQDGNVQFGLAAQGLPANQGKQVYAIWFTGRHRAPLRLGFAQTQVGKDGVLTTGGPQAKDLERFPTWFATYDHVLVTRETSATGRRPGPTVLEGTLPHGQR